ncbi:MAG: rhodanese-like domain-containing protein [Acidocella sp.]|nr:rhodanese-like domain-containing protein [Acidocella sp.]
MFFSKKTTDLRDISPAELRDALAKQEVVLVDVREPNEFAAMRIEGATLLPLSSFDPAALPKGQVVLHCAAGKRSRTAAEICAKAGVPVAGHLAGGIAAWAQAGLPVIRG